MPHAKVPGSLIEAIKKAIDDYAECEMGHREYFWGRPHKRGVFRSLRELKDAIHRFLDHTNANPKPFTWSKDPNKIIAAVRRGHQVLDSIH